MDTQTSSGDDENNEDQIKIIRRSLDNLLIIILISLGIGSLAIFLYASPAENIATYFSIVVTGLLLGWSAFAVGVLLGFIFGVPLSSTSLDKSSEDKSKLAQEPSSGLETTSEELGSTQSKPKANLPYRPNTNLEQVSDWLTKILIGVGLTQLLTLPSKLQTLGNFLAPAVGNFNNSAMFVMGEVIYFGICGFLASYLWTRVNLPKLYALSDTDSIVASQRNLARLEGFRKGQINAMDKTIPPVQQELGAGAASQQPKVILWVDDRPDKYKDEANFLVEKLRVQIENARTTEEALDKIKDKNKNFSLIISDMRRPESLTAGYDLLEALGRLGEKYPYIIYSTGTTYEKQQAAISRGATGRPIGPPELYKMVKEVLFPNS